MTGKAQHKLRATVRHFGSDVRGTTAVVFAMMAVPVLGLGLAGLDYARANGTKTAIQSAADAAANAGAQMLGAPQSEVEDAIRGYLRTNLPEDRRNLDFALTFAPEDRALTLKIDTSVSTSILGIVGVSEFAVHVETTVERPAVIPDERVPHRGVTPEIPDAITKRMPEITPRQLQEAEAAARQILETLQRQGGGADVEQLLRSLGQLR